MICIEASVKGLEARTIIRKQGKGAFDVDVLISGFLAFLCTQCGRKKSLRAIEVSSKALVNLFLSLSHFHVARSSIFNFLCT